MSESQVESVPTQVEDVVAETVEQGKRGRNPLTHADVMNRIQNPNPIDKSFGEFAESKFRAITVAGDSVATAFVLGAMLGRWSTVVKWWNESDEQKSAKEKVLAWQAEQELAAKLAKLDKAQRKVYDAADDATKSMILSLLTA